MGPRQLHAYLEQLISNDVQHAVMMWGKPGIGKSSIVRQLAESRDIEFVDVRLSQLMPSDLRGVPVPTDGTTHWAPPSFLPHDGSGILFLDEINMAPPALQGVAQQLILDRRVGDYELPDGWFVWAAGNRADDRAAVYEMPGPLANRFLHVDVSISLDDFKQYAYSNKLHDSVIGFLSFKPSLLHKVDPNNSAWPSPRTWEMASSLLYADLSVDSAVGDGVAIEFGAYVKLKEQLPDIAAIVSGKSKLKFPDEPSIAYATVTALVTHVETAKHAENAFFWSIENASAEWVQLLATDLFPQLREKGLFQKFSASIVKDARAVEFINDFVKLAA
jgi:MoxR-like ATPase